MPSTGSQMKETAKKATLQMGEKPASQEESHGDADEQTEHPASEANEGSGEDSSEILLSVPMMKDLGVSYRNLQITRYVL